jgi:hypothetical protein
MPLEVPWFSKADAIVAVPCVNVLQLTLHSMWHLQYENGRRRSPRENNVHHLHGHGTKIAINLEAVRHSLCLVTILAASECLALQVVQKMKSIRPALWYENGTSTVRGDNHAVYIRNTSRPS